MTDDSTNALDQRFAVTAGNLAALLWDGRDLLENLTFALTVQQDLLAAGRIRFLAATDRLVSEALEQVSTHELCRTMAAESVAVLCGLPAEATLAEIAAASPGLWNTVFTEHRDAYLVCAREIEALSTGNQRMLRLGSSMISEIIERTSGAPAPRGMASATSGDAAPLLIDRQA